MALMPIPMHEPLPAAHLAAELYRFLSDIRIRRCLVISNRSTVQPPSDRRLAITGVPYVVALIDGGLPVADMHGDWRRLQPGEAVCYQAGAPVRWQPDRFCRYWRVTWDTTHCFLALAEHRSDGSLLHIRGCTLAGSVPAVVEQVLQRLQPDVDPLLAGIHMTAVLAETVRRAMEQGEETGASPSITRWQDLDRYIRSHLYVACTRDRVANACGIHPSHVTRLVKQHTGLTFGAYLTSLRMELARQLLHEGQLEIRGVAAACGFRRSSHFIAQFRQHTGQTPGQYRQEHLRQ